MDIAELGYSVDSSGLVAGTKALDENAAAAEKVSGATDRLEKDFQSLSRTAQQMGVQVNGAMPTDDGRYARIAKDAVAFAESMKGANLSERALAEAAAIAASGVDVQAQAMRNAGTEQERMAARAKVLQEAEARAANQAREAAQATERQAINLKQLIGQIDPTIAKLDKLADMEERLEKAADLGMIKPQQFQQFQAQIDATRAKLLNAGKGSDEFTGSLGRLNLKSAETMRNLSQLVSATATGNFGLAGNQVLQLGTSAGATGLLFSGAGAAVAGFTALVIAGVAAWKQGQDELFDFQKNLILTGRNAEVSEAQFQGLVDQIDSLVGVSRGQAVDALGAVSASSKLVGQNMDLVAGAAARMEASTGQAIGKTVAWFEEIAKDPVDGILKLNDAVGGLDRAQMARIVTLQQEGQEQQAVAEAMAIAKDQLDELADRSDAVMPVMYKWWRDLKDEISGSWGEVVKLTSNIDALAMKVGQRLPAIGQQFALAMTVMKAASPASQIGQLNSLLGGSNLPTPIYDPGNDNRKDVADYTKLLKENEVAEKAASEALNSRISGLDRVSAKQAAYNKIIETYNKLSDSDPRHFDGSMARLIAKSNADIDKQFNQREGLNKANTGDNSAQSFVANIQRQITANEQLATSGEKVTASDRLVIQARQLLADKTNTMTAATRSLLQALIPTLETTDAQAQAEVQRQRGMQASIALAERLAQLEKQRHEQADVDLIGISRGADATQMLQRQLDIQRQYLQEREKLDKAQRDKDTALSQADYQQQAAALDASLSRSLEIERNYQGQRQALLSDWQTGFTRVWEDYAFSAANAAELAGNALANSLNAGEDAFVKLAMTGKASFSDLADSIISDLIRIQYKQAIVGMVGYLGQAFGPTITGFAGGGYTGAGGVNEPAGVVHRGEVVWSQSDIARAGGVGAVEAMRRGFAGYADGGAVAAAVPMAASRSNPGGGPVFNTEIVVHSDGSAQQNTTSTGDVGRQLADSFNAMANEWAQKQMRQGGILAPRRS